MLLGRSLEEFGMNKLVAQFFGISALEARMFLSDFEMFEWMQEHWQDLSYGSAW